MAAVLAGPPGTVASHLSAAWLWGVRPLPSRHHVTMPRSASGARAHAVVHRRPLGRADRARASGIPVTSPPRIAVDAAALLGASPLGDLVDALIVRGHTRPQQIEEALVAAAGFRSRAGRKRAAPDRARLVDGADRA